MTAIVILSVAAGAMSALLVLASLVQTMYQEAMRLRIRAVASFQFFHGTLEDRIGLSEEDGFLAFSLLKQIVVVLFGLELLVLFESTGGARLEALLESAGLAVTLLILTCHIIPNLLFKRTACRWLGPLVPLLRLLALLMKPFMGLLAFLLSVAELSDAASVKEDAPTATEQMEALIDASVEEGIIEEDEGKLLQSAASFGDKTVREVMTSRPNLVAIRQDSSLEELRTIVVREKYSRILVYEKSIDEVVGFVHVRDMFEVSDEEERRSRLVKELVRPIRVVPESKPAADLMRDLQRDGAHIALVVDEYGHTAGIATMEDLVEQIVGEIQDEHDPAFDFEKRDDGSYVFSGNFEVDRLEDLLEFQPDAGTESTTVGGLVTEWLGHLPERGEAVERDGLRIEVLASSDRRVEQVLVSRVKPTSAV